MIEKLIGLIKKLTEGRFYGTIEIVFNEGKIVHLKKIESIKL
jgi:hypothetical protein